MFSKYNYRRKQFFPIVDDYYIYNSMNYLHMGIIKNP